MACTVVAAARRSINLSVRAKITFGTHYLWHILFISAAYAGVRMMVVLKTGR
jgi:hypothetical protein